MSTGKKFSTKQIASLCWAEVHVCEAIEGCNLFLGVEESQMTHRLSHCLFTGIVCCYCRSFTANNGVSKLEEAFSQFPDPDMQNLHNDLWTTRNTVYAHKDRMWEKEKLADVNISADAVERVKIVVDGSDIKWAILRPTQHRGDIQKIKSLCEFQLERLRKKYEGIIAPLIVGKTFIDGEYTLGENFP